MENIGLLEDKYEKYQSALTTRYSITLFQLITNFLLDPEINSNDADDEIFLRRMLFETHHGRQHIGYNLYALSIINYTDNDDTIRHMDALVKLSDFYEKISVFFLQDLIDQILNTKDEFLILKYFDKLPFEIKNIFLQVVINNYPIIAKSIPKFDTYLTFS